MTFPLDGLMLPIPTPFLNDESIDFNGLARNLKKWNQVGLSGYVVLGSTGERVNLDDREYVKTIEATRSAIPDSMILIVGAGQQSTRGTIAEIERAGSAGAQVVLVITPSFYRSAMTQSALIEYYTAVADAAEIPVLLYSMPDLTGIKIEPETAARLCDHQNIIGMKDSSNDVEKFREAVQMVGKNFAMLIGNGTVFCEALQAGARGGILAVGCAVPEFCLEIYRCVRAGDGDRANMMQNTMTPLARAVTKTYGIGGLKAAMEMAGYVGGGVRAPLRRPSPEARAEIEALLRAVTRVSEASA